MQTYKTVTTVFMVLMIVIFTAYGSHAKEDKKMAWGVAGVFTAILLSGIFCMWM